MIKISHFSLKCHSNENFKSKKKDMIIIFQSIQSLSRVWLFATPRILGFPVRHQLPELTQTHVYRVGDAIQSSHPLSSPSPPTFNLSLIIFSENESKNYHVTKRQAVASLLPPTIGHHKKGWLRGCGACPAVQGPVIRRAGTSFNALLSWIILIL